MIVTVAEFVHEPAVVLTGGCFQNRYLTERAVTRLRQEGFRPYWHQRIPPNDGGISLGQIAAYLRANRSADAERSPRREEQPLLAHS
jgi:hydrogenase maturation protein HypF